MFCHICEQLSLGNICKHCTHEKKQTEKKPHEEFAGRKKTIPDISNLPEWRGIPKSEWTPAQWHSWRVFIAQGNGENN